MYIGLYASEPKMKRKERKIKLMEQSDTKKEDWHKKEEENREWRRR